MGTTAFRAALEKGAPLADVTIRFREGIDYVAATIKLNALAEDFDLHPSPFYNDPRLRLGNATKEALQRLFQWNLTRVPAYGAGTRPIYMWDEKSMPDQVPPGFENIIEEVGLWQPGANDDGQWYE